jgi:tetratricopeptide (TPR) repeat protein
VKAPSANAVHRPRVPTPGPRAAARPQPLPGAPVGPTTVSLEAPPQRRAPSGTAKVLGADGTVNLDAVAAQLHDNQGIGWQPSLDPQLPSGDPVAQGFFRARRRAHIWLWASLAAISAGVIGGTWYRIHQIRIMIAQKTAYARQRSIEATFDGDLAARDALVPVLSSRLHEREHLALAALVEARLFGEHGDEAEGAVQAILKRAEREAQRHEPARDPPTELDFARARALTALGKGEQCPDGDLDGLVGARCALRKGDVGRAQQLLTGALAADAGDARTLLEEGALAAARGDLEVADDAYARVLKAHPSHPRALVGQALALADRGKAQALPPMPKNLGPNNEAWWHLALGVSALQKGDEQGAASELDAAQSGAWRDGRLAARVGLAKIALGKVSEAERALRQAARLGPGDPELGALDAEIAVAKGFEEKVAQNLAGRDGPPRLLAIRGRAEYLAGKPKEAASSLEAALVKRPGDVVASTYLALARAKLGRATSAVNDLEKLARQHPDVTTPHYGLGLIAYERRDLATARAELQKALSHDPEAFRAGTWLGRVDRELGRTADAVAELEKVTQDDESLLAAHVTLGHLYHELGRESEARGELRRVVEANQASADDQLSYAEAMIALGQLSDADKLLTAAQTVGAPAQAVARDRLILQAAHGGPAAAGAAKQLGNLRRSQPKDQRLALAIAEAWRRAGDAKHAAEEFRQAATLGADKLHPNLGLGRSLLQTGDANGAESAFRAALSAFGGAPYGQEDRTEARVGLGRALLARKDYAEASSTLEAARDEDAESPDARYWLAKAYQEVGESAKARTEVEKAVALDDNYAGAWLFYADLTEKSDKPTAARAIKRYLELVPDGPLTKSLKRRLAQLK